MKNREIKFRFIDEDYGRPIYFSLQSMAWIDIWSEMERTAVTNWLNNEKPVDQYIGINDKNGKGIYESDILRIKNDCECCEHGIYAVEYDSFEFLLRGISLRIKNLTISFDDDVLSSEIEVIGNIHEDKDLMKYDESIVQADFEIVDDKDLTEARSNIAYYNDGTAFFDGEGSDDV